MTELPGFTLHDRVLVAAPHPDDEAIATGGVLQVAQMAGAQCRVLVVTDGDNNPWPQRWIEKRWRIGPADRARWGAQRRTEALAALQVLGIDAAAARCLGFPDLGLTGLLMSGDANFETTLAVQLAEFRPTRLFVPALHDRHPDHSALHVALRMLMSREAAAQVFTFGVHGEAARGEDIVLQLTDAQQQVKREAILRHESQMALSRRRFVAYASASERFREAGPRAAPQADHPLQARVDARGGVEIRIDHALWGASLRGYSLLAVIQGADGAWRRRRIDRIATKQADVIDSTTGERRDSASVERSEACTKLTFSLGAGARSGWAKLARPVPGLLVLDRFGWQTIDARQV